jgi:transposase
MSASIRPVSGQAGVVRTTLSDTAPPSQRMSLTMCRLTMSRWSSGSITVLSACSMAATVGD